MQLVQGLTQQEVRARQQRGESNAASFRPSRSYWDIIRANLFNFFNNILFAIGIALIALGQYNDAFTSVGQGLVNALIGTVQEINAKRKLIRSRCSHAPRCMCCATAKSKRSIRPSWSRATSSTFRPAIRLWSTGALSALAAWRWTSRC